jgi:hypothetical protein
MKLKSVTSQQTLVSSNGKTSLVHYRTLSFFAFCLKKKRKFTFFRDFMNKINIEPVPFASILLSFKINQFASLRFALLIGFFAITTFAPLRKIYSLILTTFASLRFLSSLK